MSNFLVVNFQKEFAVNKNTWNQKVAVHAQSDFYKLEDFKKGKTSLNAYELEALGDVRGKHLLHLQCHFGQDTLSLSRMGARCVGVDFSEEGISLARQLNEELGLDAQFKCCNVLEVSKAIEEQFDIVFTSYGVIGWLPNLAPWATMISERLRSGGMFYMVEFHPIAWMFDYTETPPVMKYGYDQEEAIYEEYEGTYANSKAAHIRSKEYGWNHGLSEVIRQLLKAGLQLETFQEHHGSPYNIFPNLVQNQSGLYEMPHRQYPLVYELKFVKPV